MDWNHHVNAARKAHQPFECQCGGVFQPTGQGLGSTVDVATLEIVWIDYMDYTCDKCGRKDTKEFEVRRRSLTLCERQLIAQNN